MRATTVLLVLPALVLGLGAANAQDPTVVVPPTPQARAAWQALEEARFAEAVPLFARALQATPDHPTLWLGAAIVQRRLGDRAGARTTLVRALQIDPSLTPASLLLGMLLHEQGDLAGAIRVYEAALFRSPGQAQLAAHLERWKAEAAAQEGYTKADSGRFTVLSEGPAQDALAQAALDILDDAYFRIGDALFTYPSEPVQVVLYTDEQFRDVARTPEWAGGAYDGRIKVPVRGALKDRAEFARVLTHEYVHAVVRQMASAGVPAWLHEGLAVCLERPGFPDRADIAEGPPPSSFVALPAGEVAAAYRASAAAVRAMIDRVGLAAVAALIVDVGRAVPFEQAFASHILMPYDQFLQERAAGR